MNILEQIRALHPGGPSAQLSLTPIQGDASSRRYFRVSDEKSSCIACLDPAFKEAADGEYAFLTLRALFDRHNLPVPALLGTQKASGLLLLEDFGSLSLQDAVTAEHGRELVAERYRQAVELMLTIQSIPPSGEPVPFGLSFDHEKLLFEFDFFIRHALGGRFSRLISTADTELLRREFERITHLLVLPDRFVLNHRDYHSRNLMLRKGKLALIDFQDARLGLPQYDAVSLLRDSYVRLEPGLVDELKRRHHDGLVERGLTATGFDDYCRLFELMAFQRNIKALGTFCYQTDILGKAGYEESINPTLRYLPEALGARPELQAAGRLLEPLIATATS